MDRQQLQIIKFINNLPSDVNPYLATANEFESMVHPPRSPSWSRHLRIAILVLFEIMLLQSMCLLYQRFRINRSPRIKSNNLGLVIVNVSITSAIAYLLFAILTIYVLLVHVAADLGNYPSQSTMVLIFGTKFFTVILGSWAFLWVCACQCAKLVWHSNLAARINRDVLRNIIKWGVSIFFVLATFGPLVPIAWKYAAASQELKKIESIAAYVISALRLEGKTYDPQNFSRLGLLSLLIPAKQLSPLQDRFESNLRQAQKLYFGDICLLSLVYLPLLIISLRALYNQSLSQVAIDAAVGRGQPSRPSPVSSNIRRQRQRLVYHALCVYLATSIHLPLVLHQIIISRSPGFTKTALWQEVTFQGMHAPLAITGNMILLILNFHAYLVFRDKNKSRIRGTAPWPTCRPSQNLFQKLNHFGIGSVMSPSETNTVDLEGLEMQDNGTLRSVLTSSWQTKA